MAIVRPLHALRPAIDKAERVASVPYDVVDTEEARQLAAGNPHSFLHVIRPEIDLPAGTDPYADAVYETAGKNLAQLKSDGVLLKDAEPALYVYRQIMGDHTQTGVVGCCAVDEYDSDVIKKHEKTRPDKEDDRTRHVLSLSAHAGPVFLTYRGTFRIDELVGDIVDGQSPLYDLTADDGVQHTVWKVSDAGPLTAAFADVPALYVADGHHRSASASRARAARREQNDAHTGQEDYNFFLSVLFPADQLSILAYNRVVHDLGGMSAAAFLQKLGEVMDIVGPGDPEPDERGTFAMYLDGTWHQIRARKAALDNPDPVESLDAAILQSQVLAPLLGIENPRTDKRIDFVGGIRGTGELSRRVEARGGGVAFSLYPVSLDQLMAVADAGLVLPPKSTWFEPKLRSGLLVHEF